MYLGVLGQSLPDVVKFKGGYSIRPTPKTTGSVGSTDSTKYYVLLGKVNGQSVDGNPVWAQITSGFVHSGGIKEVILGSSTRGQEILRSLGVTISSGSPAGSPAPKPKSGSIWENIGSLFGSIFGGLKPESLVNVNVPENVRVGVGVEGPVQVDFMSSVKRNILPITIGAVLVLGAVGTLVVISKRGRKGVATA